MDSEAAARTMPDGHIITDTAELRAFCDRLRRSAYVTVDTEFIRESTFWAQLCLIQVAGPPADGDEAAIIDPLSAALDLAPFFELMADERIVKVFHAARQDIEIFVKLSGSVPHPLFDTQIAATVCGYGDQVSYDQLVQRITGEGIDKSSRFTDWARRPLSARQVEYALSDVTHLRDVYLSLAAQLAEQGRTDWVAEEMAILADPQTYRSEPADAWRRLKLRVKKPRQLAVLQHLAAWREREAQERDLPRGRVLKDEAIYEIALQQPRDIESLGRLRAIPRGFERSSAGRGILGAVEQAMAVPESDLPRIPRHRPPPEHASAAAELLKVLLKMVAEEHGVAPRILASGDELEKLATDPDADVPAMKGWRRQLFGDRAAALTSGRLGLALGAGGVRAVPVAEVGPA